MISHNVTKGTFSLNQLEDVLAQAREERARAMRQMLKGVPGAVQALGGAFAPGQRPLAPQRCLGLT